MRSMQGPLSVSATLIRSGILRPALRERMGDSICSASFQRCAIRLSVCSSRVCPSERTSAASRVPQRGLAGEDSVVSTRAEAHKSPEDARSRVAATAYRSTIRESGNPTPADNLVIPQVDEWIRRTTARKPRTKDRPAQHHDRFAPSASYDASRVRCDVTAGGRPSSAYPPSSTETTRPPACSRATSRTRAVRSAKS
jgi:hypothetical protein